MNNLIESKRDELTGLCIRYHVRRLELFGSATGDRFDPKTSDLDFLVVFDSCTPSEHYERYFGLVEALESLLGRSVDLVEADAVRNPYFLRHVNESRALVYAV